MVNVVRLGGTWHGTFTNFVGAIASVGHPGVLENGVEGQSGLITMGSSQVQMIKSRLFKAC